MSRYSCSRPGGGCVLVLRSQEAPAGSAGAVRDRPARRADRDRPARPFDTDRRNGRDGHHVEELRGELQRLPVAVAAADFNPYLAGAADQVGAALTWVAWLSRTLSSGVSGAGGLAPTCAGCTRRQPRIRRRLSVSRRSPQRGGRWRLRREAARHLTISPPGPATRESRPPGKRTRTARKLATTEPVTLGRWIDLLRHVEALRRHGMHAAREAILAGVSVRTTRRSPSTRASRRRPWLSARMRPL